MQASMFAKTHSPGRTWCLLCHFYSLRFRLMLWYLLILAATLCSFSAIIYLLQQNTLYVEADTALQTAIRALPDLYSPQSGQLTNANDGIYADMYADATISVLLNPQGRVVQTAGRPHASDFYRLPVHFLLSSNTASNRIEVAGHLVGTPDDHFFSTREPIIDQAAPSPWNEYAFEIVTITDRQGRTLNHVLMGVHIDISNQLHSLFNLLVVITPLVLLISSVCGYWLVSTATRPVQAITHVAQEIGATDLRRRLNLRRRDELGELARTFDSMLDRLEGAFERQRQFTADASHELRTPLSIVNTEVERVLQRPHTCEEYIQTMEVIQQENQRMTQLVNSLLTLARADQGQTRLRCEQLDLSEIVIDAAERLASLAEQNGVEIRLANLDELFVQGDRLYLTQLCINLLENAVKYSAGVGKHVDVKMRQEPGWARIQIIDEGPGITEEHLPYLFDRFYRVDRSRTHNQSIAMGNGLGLSIARWIAQEHHGTIQIQSSPGKGSIFEIYLPLENISEQ